MNNKDGLRDRRRTARLTLAVALFSCLASAAVAGPVTLRPQYHLRVSVALRPPQIEGTLDVVFTNHSRRTLEDAVFFLFPNRFSEPGEGVNDFNRPFVYPEEDFEPGSMEILEVRDAGVAVPAMALSKPGVPPGCLVRVAIASLPPGATRHLRLRFRTLVPQRFGAFGEFDRQLTLVGGWYPYLAALDPDGTWQVATPPPLADFEVELLAQRDLAMVLNGSFLRGGGPAKRAVLPSVHYLSLVVAPELLRSEIAADGTRIVFFHRPARRAFRLGSEPDPVELMLATLRDIVVQRPRPVPEPPGKLVVVAAPLRLNLTAAGEGMVLVSDRALKVNWLLRPFHELQLAQSLYTELLRPRLAARESAADYWWVSEGVSRMLADRFLATTRPGTSSVQDWIDRFNIFAIVDRFESVPKIPFVDAFFERARLIDPLHEQVTTFNNSNPPGRVVLGKLRELVGKEEFAPLIDRCLASRVPLRRCAASAAAGYDVEGLLRQWVAPYPVINYWIGDVELNQPALDGFRSTLAIRRDSSRPYAEPVTVRLRTIGGQDVDLHWNSGGDVALMSAATPSRVYQVLIDPERKLIEERRDDNAWPPSLQVVLDSADVEISSTEFGISGLVVGRARYDYRKDLAAAAFYTNRSIGFTFGPRLHWGTPIDATRYPHNVYAFYSFQGLDSSFKDKRRPQVRTRGQLGGLGVRYDYTNVFAFDNPTNQRQLRLFADWYDDSLGSDFDYVAWGASAVATHPLWSYRTIVAGQILSGFSEPLNGSVVPNQGLYSLGGSRSIRGVGAEDELARNIFLIRAELRQTVYPEVDLNLLDLLVLRRGQLRFFVDSGRVNNSAARAHDIGRFAVGVGIGISAVYDFLGFFPATAYIEVATRVDEPSQADDVQFLFGTRQAF